MPLAFRPLLFASALAALSSTAPALAAGFENLVVSAQPNAEAGGPTTFPPDTPAVFVRADLKDVPPGAVITITWISVDSGGAAPPNFRISEGRYAVTGESSRFEASLNRPGRNWPVGTYRIAFALNNQRLASANFSIQ